MSWASRLIPILSSLSSGSATNSLMRVSSYRQAWRNALPALIIRALDRSRVRYTPMRGDRITGPDRTHLARRLIAEPSFATRA